MWLVYEILCPEFKVKHTGEKSKLKMSHLMTKPTQVAQRATIAHLSPMCQGQMWSFQQSRQTIRSKTTEKRWRHHFPHYKSMGTFCCHGNQSFDPICPKTLCSLSPIPMMLHIKFDQGWPTGFRDIQVQKCEIFVAQGQVTPKCVVWFGPKSNLTELLCLSWLQATLMTIQ